MSTIYELCFGWYDSSSYGGGFNERSKWSGDGAESLSTSKSLISSYAFFIAADAGLTSKP
jgi:hypothetical protein